MRTISATSLKTYQTCPYQWKMKYIHRLEQLPNDAFEVGTQYHKAVEMFHTGMDKEMILNQIKSEMLSEKPTSKEIDKFGLVRVMFEKYVEYPFEGETLETEYKFYIKSPKLPYPFFGFIDRIIPGIVLDYKTTGKDFKQEDIEDNPATDIYSYAFWRKYGEMPRVIYHVNNKKKAHKTNYKPQILETIRTKENVSALFVKCNKFCDDVKNEKFDPITDIHCRWCSYGKNGTKNCKYA